MSWVFYFFFFSHLSLATSLLHGVRLFPIEKESEALKVISVAQGLTSGEAELG